MAGVQGADAVRGVREFNRFYTRVIGVLDEELLDTPYTLTEARVIFELAQRPETEVVTLRRTLGLDAGYLSRILGRFESDGLLIRSRSTTDARRQVARLTAAGQQTYRTLDERSARQVETMLGELTAEQQQRLLAALRTVRGILDEASPSHQVVLRPLRSGDLGWVVQRHGVLYAEEYSWDQSFEAQVAQIVADYVAHHDPERDNAWIAEVDGQRVGCVFCVRHTGGSRRGSSSSAPDVGDSGGRPSASAPDEAETAQLRLLLVEPSARGLGIGTKLVDECARFARLSGYQRMVLWTNSVLEAARRIYERAGFTLDGEEPHRSYGHDLVAQWWSLEFEPTAGKTDHNGHRLSTTPLGI